ncbi:MAG: hypothetical protein ACLPKB_31730 [Xanthobacteraceae bacterium]
MADTEETPPERACASREHIERELLKCPDFQLYLLTKAHEDRTRMERLLEQNPSFRLWRALTASTAGGSLPNLRK